MKKWFKYVGLSIAVVLGIVALAGIALAQGPEDDGVPPVGQVDEDGDGLCDICGAEIGDGFMRGWRFNQEGETPWPGREPSTERPFVDEDGDGVCDVCAGEPGEGFERGWRYNQDGDTSWPSRGPTADRPFADEDGDGVCDECGSSFAGTRDGIRGGRMGSRAGRR